MENGSNSSSSIRTFGSRVAAWEDSGRPTMFLPLIVSSFRSGVIRVVTDFVDVSVGSNELEGDSSPRMESNSSDIRRSVVVRVVVVGSFVNVVRLRGVKGGWGMVKDRVDSFGSSSTSASDAGSIIMTI